MQSRSLGTGFPNEMGVAAPVRFPSVVNWATRIAQSFGAAPHATVCAPAPSPATNVLWTTREPLRFPPGSAWADPNGSVCLHSLIASLTVNGFPTILAELHCRTAQSPTAGVSMKPVPVTLTVWPLLRPLLGIADTVWSPKNEIGLAAPTKPPEAVPPATTS